jgi:hypothetical protein
LLCAGDRVNVDGDGERTVGIPAFVLVSEIGEDVTRQTVDTRGDEFNVVLTTEGVDFGEFFQRTVVGVADNLEVGQVLLGDGASVERDVDVGVEFLQFLDNRRAAGLSDILFGEVEVGTKILKTKKKSRERERRLELVKSNTINYVRQ